jgi:hypothetical protein
MTSDFEIILVNDGSPDNSLEIALSIYRKTLGFGGSTSPETSATIKP